MPQVLLPVLFSCMACCAGIVFKQESVTTTIIACDTLEVKGVYYFKNGDTSTMSTAIYYPFPVDSALKYPHFIDVVRLSNHQRIAYVKSQLGMRWKQNIPPLTIDSIRVTYRQKALKAKGRYILTTTQDWNRPIEQADFTVRMPHNISLQYWSFQADSINMRNGLIYFHSSQKNFFPKRDMLLEWHCEKGLTY